MNSNIKQYWEVLTLLEMLEERGWNIISVEDEDEEDGWNCKSFTPKEAYDWVNQFDECAVEIQKNDKRCYLWFVLGNEPGTALSNYTVNDEIDEVSEIVYEQYSKEYSYHDVKILRDEINKVKNFIKDNTECFEGNEDLFQMVTILVSQRDNAYAYYDSVVNNK